MPRVLMDVDELDVRGNSLEQRPAVGLADDRRSTAAGAEVRGQRQRFSSPLRESAREDQRQMRDEQVLRVLDDLVRQIFETQPRDVLADALGDTLPARRALLPAWRLVV